MLYKKTFLAILLHSIITNSHAMEHKYRSALEAEEAAIRAAMNARAPQADVRSLSEALKNSILKPENCPARIHTIVAAWKKKYIVTREMSAEERKRYDDAYQNMNEDEKKKHDAERKRQDDESSNYQDIPKGWLFVGPSGTGKSTIGKAIAKECGIPCFMYRATQFATIMKSSGTEGLNIVFAQASELNKPCIIIIDELEGLIKQHDNRVDSETNMLQCLWTLLDQYEHAPILFIGTLNDISNAVKPIKTRFVSHTIEIPLPTDSQRIDILKYYMSPSLGMAFDSDVTAEKLAAKTSGFAHRELERFIRSVRNKKGELDFTATRLSMKHCEEALEEIARAERAHSVPFYRKAGSFISKHSGAIFGALGFGISAYALYDSKLARKESARLHQENLEFQRKTFAFQQQQAAESARLAQEIQEMQRITFRQQQFDRSIQGQVAKGLGQGMAAGLTQPKIGPAN